MPTSARTADAATLQAEYQGETAHEAAAGDGAAAGEPVELVDAGDGRVGHRGHRPRVAEAARRRGRRGRHDRRGLDRQGRRRGPLARRRAPCSRRSSSRTTSSRSARRSRGSRPARVRREPAAAPDSTRPPPAAGNGGAAADSDAKASPVAQRIAAAEGVDLSRRQRHRRRRADHEGRRDRRQGGRQRSRRARRRPRARRRSSAAPPGCSRRRWRRAARSRPRPRSGRSPSTRSTPSARPSTAPLSERGMKVSFTHLIAWAIVEAGKEWRAMSRSFEERDGKPNVDRPRRDQPRDRRRRREEGRLAEPDGPVHPGRRPGRLQGLPRQVRGADPQDARELADRRRLHRHQHHADQPRRPRHRRLGPAADERPGDDRRHRLDRLPAGVVALAAPSA